MHRLALSTPVRDLAGKPFLEAKQGDDGKIVYAPIGVFETLKTALLLAMGGLEGDAATTLEEKLRIHLLASAITNNDVVDLTSDQQTMLKDRVNRCYPSPIIVGQIVAMIDPPLPPPRTEKRR